jgi:ribose transport system substrate-binding protein
MAKLLGWNFHLFDGRGCVASRRGLNQAIALQPDGIVLGTIDAYEQAAVIEALRPKASA